MATLNATLTLSSKNATSNEINLTVTKALSVTDPIVGVSKVSATGTGGDNIILASHSSIRYLYLKHTGLDASDAATAHNLAVEIENNKSFAELGPGEFLFVPIGQNSGSVAVQLEAVSGTIVAEYAYFTEV
tara:strand:+ start:649 stop:1041 length:393 start_codon:yes stop_codon:yes gene_type:complete